MTELDHLKSLYDASKSEFEKGSRRISIRNLPKNFTQEDFKNYFNKLYRIESFHFESNKANPESCKLIMESSEEAKKIIDRFSTNDVNQTKDFIRGLYQFCNEYHQNYSYQCHNNNNNNYDSGMSIEMSSELSRSNSSNNNKQSNSYCQNQTLEKKIEQCLKGPLEITEASSDFMICVTGLHSCITVDDFRAVMERASSISQKDDENNPKIVSDKIEKCLLIHSPREIHNYQCKNYGIVEYTQKSSSIAARNISQYSANRRNSLSLGQDENLQSAIIEQNRYTLAKRFADRAREMYPEKYSAQYMKEVKVEWMTINQTTAKDKDDKIEIEDRNAKKLSYSLFFLIFEKIIVFGYL